LKVHCGLHNPDGVAMRIGSETLQWEVGRCYLLDDSFEHSITSLPHQGSRTILDIQITHPDLLTANGYIHNTIKDVDVAVRIQRPTTPAGLTQRGGENAEEEEAKRNGFEYGSVEHNEITAKFMEAGKIQFTIDAGAENLKGYTQYGRHGGL